MSDLVIQNIDDRILKQLKEKADSTGVSLESQVVSILESTLGNPIQSRQENILDIADAIRNKHAHRQVSDSTILIREDRNNR